MRHEMMQKSLCEGFCGDVTHNINVLKTGNDNAYAVKL